MLGRHSSGSKPGTALADQAVFDALPARCCELRDQARKVIGAAELLPMKRTFSRVPRSSPRSHRRCRRGRLPIRHRRNLLNAHPLHVSHVQIEPHLF